MRCTTTKPAKRKRPGPCPMGALPWAEAHSFFDSAVQEILLNRKDRLGWPITCWEVVEYVTQRYNPKREHGFTPLMQFKNEDAKREFWRARQHDFFQCNNRGPDFIAPLFAAMTSFHKTPPREWPQPRKLACLSTIGELEWDEGDAHLLNCSIVLRHTRMAELLKKRSFPLRHPRTAELFEKWFGNEISSERIRVELSRERTRRENILASWQSHFEYLNQQLDAGLTVTPSP